MINQIAMFTAIIATSGAIFSYIAGSTQSNAGMFKNNAAITKTEAANQWNFFQSKSTKQSLAELAHDLAVDAFFAEEKSGDRTDDEDGIHEGISGGARQALGRIWISTWDCI